MLSKEHSRTFQCWSAGPFEIEVHDYRDEDMVRMSSMSSD